MRLRNGRLSEQLPATPGRERCPGISMVDVFDVDRFLGTLFLPWNQVDLIFGNSGQPFFGPLYFEVGPDF